MDDDHHGPPILKPLPRRAFEITPASADTSLPATPRSTSDFASQVDARLHASTAAEGGPPSRTRSILNLTSSTLFGIYQPTGYDNIRDSEPATPWGTGAETPSRRESIETEKRPLVIPTRNARPSLGRIASHQPHQHGARRGRWKDWLSRAARILALFVIGMAYGVIVSHLHDNQHIAPVRMELGIARTSWTYLAFWGVAGVALGSALPWVDWMWEGDAGEGGIRLDGEDGGSEMDLVKAAEESDWHPVVRSIGAFVGIAYAIRKLPWQSTLQVSLTLALVNPVLWYLIDRSRPGFALSSLVGLAGTTALLFTNPDIVPSPAAPHAESSKTYNASRGTASAAASEGEKGELLLGGMVSYESVGVATWILSVLFCSCVCFGNIGRRLAGGAGRRAGR
ncbi:hypothetical protein H2201_008408 [Coniosporium apollinis]|uniref:Insulin-induced protein n=1 Tax=Coniosporium apollinis TaxID=61459 RepID=A0ABQ9NIR3_9PEZI|nr:hypothetical protein H2201_008408 [Coniosporium apollinis]